MSPKNEEQISEEKFDAKWLSGLTIGVLKEEKVKVDGKTETKMVPVSRPLVSGDVIGWKDYGGTVAIVAADGQKHTVKK